MGKKSLLYLTIYGSVVRFLCPQIFSVSLKHLFGQFSALTNSLYFFLSLFYSQVGIGSYVVHYFSSLVTSILENFGLSEEMHNPVSNLSCSVYLSQCISGKIVVAR
jgi:hypothetical protein